VKVTSERLAQLESVQIEVEGRLKSIDDAQDVSNTHLQDILTRLEGLEAAPSVNNSAAARDSTGGHATSWARHVAFGDPQHPATKHEDNYEDYAGDTEDDTTINHNNNRAHRQLCFNRHGMARAPPRDYDHSNAKIKFTMPTFNGKYSPDDYLDLELLVDQKFAC
jgi:hypothetical protein